LAQPAWARDFRLLMAGSFASMLGSRISTIACPLLALWLTNSPVDAGLVAFAATIPSVLFYIPAGALVDRWDPRRAMFWCESGRGAAVAVIALSLLMGKPSIFVLIPVVIVEEVLEVFSTLAELRCVRDVVPQEWASSAQVGIETRSHVVVLMGRPLGVLLFSLGPILPFLADALSFVVSVFVAVNLKVKQATGERSGQASGNRLDKDIITALKVVLRDKYARAAMVLSAGTTLIGQALIMIVIAIARTSDLSSVWVGLVLAASGAGGVIGAVSVPWLRTPPKTSLVLLQMLAWFTALGALAVWGWRSFLCMAAVMAALSFTGAFGNIEIDTYLVRTFEEKMLARVTSFGRLVSFSASALGPMLGGVLIQFGGTRVAVLALAGIAFSLVTLAWFTPPMRNPCFTPSTRNRQVILRLVMPVLQSLRETAGRLYGSVLGLRRVATVHGGLTGTAVFSVVTAVSVVNAGSGLAATRQPHDPQRRLAISSGGLPAERVPGRGGRHLAELEAVGFGRNLTARQALARLAVSTGGEHPSPDPFGMSMAGRFWDDFWVMLAATLDLDQRHDYEDLLRLAAPSGVYLTGGRTLESRSVCELNRCSPATHLFQGCERIAQSFRLPPAASQPSLMDVLNRTVSGSTRATADTYRRALRPQKACQVPGHAAYLPHAARCGRGLVATGIEERAALVWDLVTQAPAMDTFAQTAVIQVSRQILAAAWDGIVPTL
jgi:MFS family permease